MAEAPRGWRLRRAPGVSDALLGPGGDPDWLLTRSDCDIVKYQRKVVVGRITRAGETIYIKRYNVFATRVALMALVRMAPAMRAWRAAERLSALGMAVPPVLAALEKRRAGLLRRSFLITRAVEGLRADQVWRALLADSRAPARPPRRRAFARSLGTLLARMHAARVYHPDFKDYNLLERSGGDRYEWVLLDLEDVRLGIVSHRRRVKNLMQLDRTLGRLASRTDRLRTLAAYLDVSGAPERATRRRWVADVARATRRKEAGRRARPSAARPAISAMIVCQNEADQIVRCLASVSWCEELLVVDGGSRDATVALATRLGARVIEHRWPGYRAQKQFALDHATYPWVFNVDADERVSAELASEIERALVGVADDVGGFTVPRLVPFLGRWWYRGGWYPRPVLRLLRRSMARWGGLDPHERAEAQGRILRLRAPIFHHSYENIASHLGSIGKLTAVATASRTPDRRIGVGRLVLEPGWRFVRFYLLRGSILEGLPGLYAAATDAFYVFLRASSLWRRQRAAEPPHGP